MENKLPQIWEELEVKHYPELGSTNDFAKEYLRQHPDKEILVIADQQTAGRGRRNRTFYSKIDYGLYFTLGIQVSEIHPNDLPLYTVAAATAMLEAIEQELGLELQVKWVNDLFYQGRKVAGILTETMMDAQTNRIQQLVIGIGLNIAGSFAEADADTQITAGTLYEKIPATLSIESLVGNFLQKFKQYHENLSARAFIPRYRQHLLGLNQEITYRKQNQHYVGQIKGINDQGQLLIQKPNGQIEVLLADEIHFSSQQFTQN